MRHCVKQNKQAAVYRRSRILQTITYADSKLPWNCGLHFVSEDQESPCPAIGSTATGVELELPLYEVLGCPSAGPRPGLLLGGGGVSERADPADSLTW